MYKKILKLSSSARKYLEVGAIMNHINVDVNAIILFIVMNGFLFSAPAMIFVAIIMLIMEVGWIGFAAPLLFAIGMIFQQKLLSKGL
jgi:ABC-type nickel/cobalt efflux system permease component RcnA